MGLRKKMSVVVETMFSQYKNKRRRKEKQLEARLQREYMLILEGKILAVLNSLLLL